MGCFGGMPKLFLMSMNFKGLAEAGLKISWLIQVSLIFILIGS
jgi:hypothetical protein